MAAMNHKTNEEITRDLFIREIRRLEAELEQRTKHYQRLQERYDGLLLDLEQARARSVRFEAELARLKVGNLRSPLGVGLSPYPPTIGSPTEPPSRLGELLKEPHQTIGQVVRIGSPPKDDDSICGEPIEPHPEFF
jgi:hypothetical protein